MAVSAHWGEIRVTNQGDNIREFKDCEIGCDIRKL